jgi:uncharacterized Zn finger protein (UPF0148 family)
VSDIRELLEIIEEECCHDCGGDLVVKDGEIFCPDCVAFIKGVIHG